jgi:tetratricopeptide (TPR) repeat protein
MSRDTEKFLKQLTQQIKSQNLETEAELQAFLEQMNSQGFENLSEVFDDADKAYEEYILGCELMASGDDREIKEAVKHLKKAIKLDPPFFDAQTELLSAESDFFTYLAKLQALEAEAETGGLQQAEYEREEAYGHAWGIIELRPFMRIKLRLAATYLEQGMYRLAAEKFEEALAWNENDNQGIRSTLIGLYAFLEDEERTLVLYQRFGEEQSAWNLLALATLYFKFGDEKASNSYIKRLIKAVPETFEVLFSISEDPDSVIDAEIPHYRPGSQEELVLAFRDLGFLLNATTGFLDHLTLYIIKQRTMSSHRKQPAKTKGRSKGKSKKTAKGGNVVSLDEARKL